MLAAGEAVGTSHTVVGSVGSDWDAVNEREGIVSGWEV